MENTALLMPRYRFRSVLDITPEDLKKMGAEAVALDIDNTLAPDGTFHYVDGASEWVERIKAAGFPMMIVSNGSFIRVAPIAKHFGLPYVCFSGKPKPKGLLKAAERMATPIEKVAMIGDQLFSDIKAANSCGAIAVRTDPTKGRNLYPCFYKWNYKREVPILKEFEKTHGYGVEA